MYLQRELRISSGDGVLPAEDSSDIFLQVSPSKRHSLVSIPRRLERLLIPCQPLPNVPKRAPERRMSAAVGSSVPRSSQSLTGRCSFDIDLSPIPEDYAKGTTSFALSDWRDIELELSLDYEHFDEAIPIPRDPRRQSDIPSVVLTIPTPQLDSMDWSLTADRSCDALGAHSSVTQIVNASGTTFSLPASESETTTAPSDIWLDTDRPCLRCRRAGNLCICEDSVRASRSSQRRSRRSRWNVGMMAERLRKRLRRGFY